MCLRVIFSLIKLDVLLRNWSQEENNDFCLIDQGWESNCIESHLFKWKKFFYLSFAFKMEILFFKFSFVFLKKIFYFLFKIFNNGNFFDKNLIDHPSPA
jgi:hypothetical protein